MVYATMNGLEVIGFGCRSGLEDLGVYPRSVIHFVCDHFVVLTHTAPHER